VTEAGEVEGAERARAVCPHGARQVPPGWSHPGGQRLFTAHVGLRMSAGTQGCGCLPKRILPVAANFPEPEFPLPRRTNCWC